MSLQFTWSEREILNLREWHMQGLTQKEISIKLQRTLSSTKSKMQQLGLKVRDERRLLERKRTIDPFPAFLHYTPMQIAEMELANDFEDIRGAKFYKGKVVNHFHQWHDIIRDANRKRKAENRPQINDYEGWLV